MRALRAVLAALTLPPTVVTASRSRSGEAKAVSNPVASSTPGSQSMIRLCFTDPVCRLPPPESIALRLRSVFADHRGPGIDAPGLDLGDLDRRPADAAAGRDAPGGRYEVAQFRRPGGQPLIDE